MFTNDCLQINEAGHLAIGGVDALDIAREYGTPAYVMDEAVIRQSCRAFIGEMGRLFPAGGGAAFACKALCCKALCRIMAEEGMHLDVSSGGELYTAIQSGFPADRILMQGNNKSEGELRLALESGVGRIVVDNAEELGYLNELTRGTGVTVAILLRIKPGVEAHTHEYVQTGQIDSKFGFAPETGEAEAAVKAALASPNLRLAGVSCHIGSQIFETAPFALAAGRMLAFIAEMRDRFKFTITELDLGGGFAVRYLPSDVPPPGASYLDPVAQALADACAEYDFPMPQVFIEPGRSIVAESGITLYTVGSVKHIPGVRDYILVDGGMTDNPRYMLYQAAYQAVVASKAGQPRDHFVTIAGKCCESGDLIQEHTPLQSCGRGDVLAVLSTGAFNYSMASNYNRLPRPPIVMVRDGKTYTAVRRESYDDLLRCDQD